jgi:glycosyltransferase involved in cell wall biosynthesis
MGEPGRPVLRIGMVAYGDITHDSRVQREARSLAEAGHHVSLYCLGAEQGIVDALAPGVQVVVRPAPRGAVIPGTPSPFRANGRSSRVRRLLDRLSWLVRYGWQLRSWGRGVVASAPQFDAWHVHDFTGLVSVAPAIPRTIPLVYDVHDLFVETGSASRLPRPVRSLLVRYERRLTRRVGLAIAVNSAVADIFRVRCNPRRMIVVHNCPPRWEARAERYDLIRSAAGIPREAPVVLYHGVLGAQRGLEMLCEAMLQDGLGSAHLALLGYGHLREDLIARAAEPRFGGRIHVLDPVTPAELLPWVASADVGAMPLPKLTLNLYVSTPNKLFECLAAGTPVVVSNFPAVTQIVLGDPAGPLGAGCDPADVADIARAIAGLLSLSPDAMSDLRERCARAARERWNWEAEGGRLVEAYATLPRVSSPG